MAPGATREVVKAVNTFLPVASLPLPDDLLEVIQDYLDKHAPFDEGDAQRLQDELLLIYQKDVKDQPSRYPVFLAILRNLRPGIAGYKRLLQWWDMLLVPILDLLGQEKGLAAETRLILLDILTCEDDNEEKKEEARRLSAALTSNLLELYLKTAAKQDSDAASKFLQEQIHNTLMEYGKSRPKQLLTAINRYFVQKKYRAQVLVLMGEFIRYGPPHLYQLLHTPLWHSLLRCLEIDTSTTVISLAMTVLVMLLPHIPNSVVTYIPTLFKIYSRLLFWERERKPTKTEAAGSYMQIHEDDVKTDDDQQWEKLFYSEDTDQEMVPEILTYFTFLYGLFPLNFMSYIRKPERYLRHANFDDSDEMDVQPSEVRQRSEPFRQVHLLHSNFFSMTLKSEITDKNRWIRSEAADVTAVCMSFYAGTGNVSEIGMASPLAQQGTDTCRDLDVNSVSLDGRLLSPDCVDTQGVNEHPSMSDMEAEGSEGIQRNSWRNTTTTLVDPMVADHEIPYAPLDHGMRTARLSFTEPKDIVSRRNSTKNVKEMSADEFIQNLSRSPSLRPSTVEPTNTAPLHREIMLLKNDLNFERYLKQQHLSHIGHLRTKHVREATVEAETQNFINVNRGLKSKLEEARSAIIQMKRETDKSKAQAKKWEADLTTKLRALKEEQKKWLLESEDLNRQLATAKDNILQQRGMIVAAEARELASQQKMQSVETNYDELEHLRAETERLKTSVRLYEARDHELQDAGTERSLAESSLHTLEMKLAAQHAEASQVQLRNDEEIERLRIELDRMKCSDRKGQSAAVQSMIDSAVSALRSKLAETQNAHAHLLQRFTALEAQLLLFKESQEGEDTDLPLLGGAAEDYLTAGDHRTYGKSQSTPTSPYRDTGSPGFLNSKSAFRLSSTPGVIGSPRTPGSHFARVAQDSHSRAGSLESFGADNSGSGTDDTSSGKIKAQPQSEVRFYGRGGVQNIGKKSRKEKENKDKGKDEEGSGKKEKKKPTLGMMGIRGFGA